MDYQKIITTVAAGLLLAGCLSLFSVWNRVNANEMALDGHKEVSEVKEANTAANLKSLEERVEALEESMSEGFKEVIREIREGRDDSQ